MLAASRLEERTQSSDTAGSGRARLASARLAATKRARLAATKRAQLAAARKESRTHHLNGVSMLEAARAQARQQKRVFGMARFGPSESLARRLAPSYTTAPFGDLTVTVLATRDLRHLAGSAAAAAAVETAWSERCVSVSFSHAILSPLKLHISLSSTHSTTPHHTTPHRTKYHTHTHINYITSSDRTPGPHSTSIAGARRWGVYVRVSEGDDAANGVVVGVSPVAVISSSTEANRDLERRVKRVDLAAAGVIEGIYCSLLRKFRDLFHE